MIAKAFDCSTPLTATTATALKAQGFSAAGRYLGAKTHGWSKAITPAEVAVLKDAGLMIVSIWEGNPTSVGYFTYAQGVKDATEAVLEAQWLEQPVGSTIYFTVDYDCQDADMDAIRSYLQGVYKNIGSYKMGVYGGKRVMDNVSADFYWQTVAWSGGQVSPRACMLQHAPAVMVAGVEIDSNDVITGPGWWNQPTPVAPVVTPAPAKTPIVGAGDVFVGDWYDKAVEYVTAEGIMHVDANGNFNPNASVTRAQLAQAIYATRHQTN